MCGIVGFIDFDGILAEEARCRLECMTSALHHRGPDSEGFHIDAHAALGHRRLAIIDVSSGQQPMAAADGKVQIVFNGEIYNYLELRAELEAVGHKFRTESDTEVLLNGYLEWGSSLPGKLNGMFAFLIWDARKRCAFAARDRAGEKPFYWVRNGNRFAFASELQALRAGGFLDRHPALPEALDCYLTLGFVPAPRTIYDGVYKLLPAQQMEVGASGQSSRAYWTLPAPTSKFLSMDEALDEFEPLFDDAVKRQLMSDVPLGAFLSGGIDSALVVSSMARQSSRVVTNTIGSSDKSMDERSLARQVASAFGTEHHEHEIGPPPADAIRRILGHLDEPLGDPSVIPTWWVCKMTRQNVTVALSGDGGDESFAGYTFRYYPHLLESRIRRRLPTAIRAPVFGGLGAIWPRSRRLPKPLRLATLFSNLALSDSGAYMEDLSWLKASGRRSLYTSAFLDELSGFEPREVIQPYYESGPGDPLWRCQKADQMTYMTDDVLVKVDRMSMAHSLEARAPLLDYRIREFAAQLPLHLRMHAGQGKLLLRALAARRLPASLVSAPKRGFSINLADWLRGDLRDYARQSLFPVKGVLAGRVDSGTMERLWADHQTGKRDHSAVIWNLLVASEWSAGAKWQ